MSNFWYGKRVSLLGGASLIGTHLAQALIERGVAGLRIVDDFSAGKFSNVSPLIDEYEIEVRADDLRDYQKAFNAVHKADVVFHLAAQHGGRGYVASHKVELYDNLALDTTIFRACSDAKVQKVIFSSSACAYPIGFQRNPDDTVRLSEDLIHPKYKHLSGADGAYGTEKLVGEAILDAYIERGDFAGCSTRSFTVYGPLMGETHAIAALIGKTMIKQDPFEIWGSGLQVRNWTFVEDNVAGALLAAERLERGAINIGIEERITPLYAAHKIWDYMGWQPERVLPLLDKPVGPLNRVADATALKALGWTPSVTFEEGLHRTIDWYVSTHDTESLKKDLERRLTER